VSANRTPSLRAGNRFLLGLVLLVSACAPAETRLAAQAQARKPPAQIFPSDPLWKQDVSAKPVAVAAPVASSDRLFLALESGMTARRMTDGSEIWNQPIVADGPMAVSDRFLVVQSKGQVHVLSTENGKTAWTAQTGALTAPPLLVGDALYVAAGEQLTAYQVSDGSKRWSHDVGVVEQRPAVEGAHIYVPVADGRLVALTADAGKQLWDFDAGIKPTEPVVYGDRVFIGSAAKIFCSVKMQNGQEDWCFPVGAVVFGRAAVSASHVYYVALDNLLRAHERRRGELKWHTDLKYRPSAGPTIVGTSVSAPGLWSVLQAFDGVTGKPVTQLTLGDKLAGVPVFITSIEDGRILLAAVTGSLNNQWTLTLAGPPPMTPPVLPIVPLTVLPGTPIRPGAPLVLPASPPRDGERLR
jgi:outer membrane protein assembly factor BamB